MSVGTLSDRQGLALWRGEQRPRHTGSASKDSRDVLKRYFLLTTTKTRTISQWKIARISDNPAWLAYRERLYEGLRIAGMPEE